VGWPVSLHFPAPDRRNWTERQRVDELVRWMEIIARPDGREHIYRAMLRTFGDILLEHGLVVTQEALEREQTLRAKAEGERDAEQALRTRVEAERNAEQALRAKAEANETQSKPCAQRRKPNEPQSKWCAQKHRPSATSSKRCVH